jgi:hypothetical protein
MSEFIPEDLVVDEPAYTVRWRLHSRALPLKNRHLRAFGQRGVSKGLDSWARQHIEWTLAEGAAAYPNGVLTLSVDDQGRAVMATEPYVPLPALDAAGLVARAALLADDPVPGEVLWASTNAGLTVFVDAEKPLSGANSLMVDLAATQRRPLAFAGAVAAQPPADAAEVFLVSDEHGVVGAADASGELVELLSGYYNRLVGLAKPDQYDRTNLGLL